MLATTHGFITVPRLDKDLLGDEQETTQTNRGAWHWLFDKAAWKPHTERFGRFAVDLRRGEIACSYRFLARAWNWSHGRVQRWLKVLADRAKISLRIENGIVVISLSGYSVRRESNPESQKTSLAAAERPVDDQQPSQKENKKSESLSKVGGLVRRFAPPRATATPEGRKQARLQLIFQWVGARLHGAEAMAARMGLMADDPAEAQRWLDRLDARVRAEKWTG